MRALTRHWILAYARMTTWGGIVLAIVPMLCVGTRAGMPGVSLATSALSGNPLFAFTASQRGPLARPPKVKR